MNTPTEKIIVYGCTWCFDCKRTRAFLDRNQITYDWIDIEKDAAACAYVEKVNRGYRSVPTILFPNGDVLVEPAESVLAAKFSNLIQNN